MSINFDEIKTSLINVLRAVFEENKPAVVNAVDQYVNDSKQRLLNLAEGAANGSFSYDFVIKRLKEEAINAKDYLLSIGEIAASDAQEIINKAVDIFQFAINDAMGAYQAPS